MMTKYEELAHLGVEHSKEFYRIQQEAWRFAGKLMRRLADYLQCPAERMSYIDILPNLDFGVTKGSVQGSSPEMMYGLDGFWYFGITFLYTVPEAWKHFGHHHILFGIKVRPDGFVIRHGKDVEIQTSDEAGMDRFCEDIFNSFKASYATPIGEPEARIGFVAPKSSQK